jgi:heptosyltransferase-2
MVVTRSSTVKRSRDLIVSTEHLHNIVWLQTAFIGDIVLTTGAFALAAQHFPHARQHVVTTPEGCSVLKGSPHLASCIPYAKRRDGLRGLGKIKRTLTDLGVEGKTSLLLQAHRSYRSSVLSRFLGLPTITYRQSNLSWLAKVRVDRSSAQHEVNRVALLLEPLGISRQDIMSIKPSLVALPWLAEVAWQQELKNFPGQLIGIAVGSKWGTKRWPVEKFAQLADRLLQEDSQLGVVLLGGPDEVELTQQAETQMRSGKTKLWNLAGKTSFDDLRRVMPKLSVVVSNDSSPVHFAAAFDVPTVAIFGPTTPQMGFAPLSTFNRVVEMELACRPCSAHGPQVCPLGHFKCMKDLGVDRVFDAVMELRG